NCSVLYTNVLVNNYDWLYGAIQGHAAFLTWSFSDGPVYSNLDNTCVHQWTSAGTYPVTLTAYNNDNPSGVSTNLLVYVVPPLPAQIQSPVLLTNGFGFQFVGQMSANYLIQYTTNLSPPITWQELQEIVCTNQGTLQFLDPSAASAPRFYRVVNQSTGF
ncbi:MAG TPA: PKD domain-containing protein, partial [Candidatus Acidoferrum sp.]|nr:PKD domain-containing protein [Candidatus Acidoferrum sp.]